MKPVVDFRQMERNVYSQGGEDGVIGWVFSQIEPRHRICVEFGAWDGRNLSNTFNLVAHQGWKAIYIEADPRKFRALKKTATAFPTITPVHGLVAAAGEYSLDRILERQGIPENFDLLSIDVDGADYDIWEGMTRFHPALVVIEHNPWIPPGIEYIDRAARTFMGSSATSLSKLAVNKGYGLLGCTFSNSLFLRDELFSALNVRPQMVDEAFDRREVCSVFMNFAGEVVFSNSAIAQRLRSVVYRSHKKTLIRWLLGMPTFHVLGQSYAKDGAILRLLRRAASFVQG